MSVPLTLDTDNAWAGGAPRVTQTASQSPPIQLLCETRRKALPEGVRYQLWLAERLATAPVGK